MKPLEIEKKYLGNSSSMQQSIMLMHVQVNATLLGFDEHYY